MDLWLETQFQWCLSVVIDQQQATDAGQWAAEETAQVVELGRRDDSGCQAHHGETAEAAGRAWSRVSDGERRIMTNGTQWLVSAVAAADIRAGDLVGFDSLAVAVVREVTVDNGFVTLELTVTRRADDVIEAVRLPQGGDEDPSRE